MRQMSEHVTPDRVVVLLGELGAARSFEDAADALLAAVLGAAVEALVQGRMRVLRGMVHLRPADSYRGIRLREVDDTAPRRTGRSTQVPRLLPSMTAWHFVEHTGGAIVLDVRESRAHHLDGRPLEPKGAPSTLDFRSRDALLGREATHILALPLWRPGGALDGFVTTEMAEGDAGAREGEHSSAGALAALGAAAPRLKVLVDLASPYLGMLPRAPCEEVAGEDDLLPVMGQKMRPLMEDLRLFAGGDETLLLQGETGVGKSQLARRCAAISRRSQGPFVRVNLTEVPENLREAQLFGWVRGAFTGAAETHKGFVEEAHGGTLFIDEIDKLSPQGQAMLLTLLDEGEYRAIGDNALRRADVRFIVGTNANLRQAIAEGRFLRDLYYRIRVMPVTIPPLRERRDEIAAWGQDMIRRRHKRSGRQGRAELDAAAASLLEGQPWPGNLRELESIVKGAYDLAARGTGADVVVRIEHAARALELQKEPGDPGLCDLLRQAAGGFVDAIAMSEGSLKLDDAEVFAGYVMCAAIERFGERDAFRVLGRENSLKSSNHLKSLNRERERVTAFEAKLPQP